MNNKEKVLKTRDQIDDKYKWNISAMYPSEDLWEKDYALGLELSDAFSDFVGKLSLSPAMLADACESRDRIWQTIERVFAYAHMKKDEDNREPKYQSMLEKSHSLMAKASANMAFFTPELLEIPESKIKEFIASEPRLSIYEFAILDTLREKAHVLTHAEETLMSRFDEVFAGPDQIFSMLNDADMKFGEVIDEDGTKVELTHGNFTTFMESKDRNIRKDAFTKKYRPYKDFINTISTTYNYNTKTNVLSANIRKYPSALEASLQGDNIPKEVYTNLIDAINESLPALHKYMDLRKKVLGVDELHMYDVYVPLVQLPKIEIPFEKGVEMIKDCLQILGDDYVEKVTNGINSGWIDVYENKGKTSGAYSFGSYDSYPYILLNYAGKLHDVFVLIHEMGHSMHSLYTRQNQPFVYGNYSIFTAEVASTVNENLLSKYLLENEKDIEMRKYLLNLEIEQFRATVYRQTMFAEFEKLTHEFCEAGEVLTADFLCKSYGDLNKKYFGKNVVSDDEINYEWARIPHFYNDFYVYMYATGYSAASAIADKITEDTKKDSTLARDSYIEFLKSGSSNHPIELLKIAGIDMSKKEPVERATKTFESLVDELIYLMK